MKGLDKYKQLEDHLNKKQEHKKQDHELNESFKHVITLKVSEETFEAWELLCENWGDVLGYDNKSKVFEFAIIEALNVPIASLGGFNI
mgnify:FL=1